MQIKITGPFKRERFGIVDSGGLRIATLRTSLRITTEDLESVGDLLASAWELRELLGHTLLCSGSPADCDECKKAQDVITREREVKGNQP